MRLAWHRLRGLVAVCLILSLAAAAASVAASAAAATLMAQAARQAAPKTVVFSQNDVHGKTVATGAHGLTQILFADGTTLTLGPSSEVTINAFAFDPAGGRATIGATLSRGVFRFIGGRTAKTPDGVTFTTPFGTLAIDSAGADLSLGEDGAPPHFEMVFGRGSMTLAKGSRVLARVHALGYSIVPDSAGGAGVRKTPDDWRRALEALLS